MGRSHHYTSEHVVGSALTYRKALIHAAFFATVRQAPAWLCGGIQRPRGM